MFKLNTPNTASTIAAVLNAAIERSISHNEIVRVEVESVEAALLALHLRDGDIDHVEVEDGTDVWGWSSETPADSQDWRLLLVDAARA